MPRNIEMPQNEDYKEALKFAHIILAHMIKEKNKPIEYGQLAIKVNRHQQDLGFHLGVLVCACHELKLPLITAIVVHKDTKFPDLTFYELAAKKGYFDGDPKITKEAVYNQKCWWKLIKHLEDKIYCNTNL